MNPIHVSKCPLYVIVIMIDGTGMKNATFRYAMISAFVCSGIKLFSLPYNILLSNFLLSGFYFFSCTLLVFIIQSCGCIMLSP